jgi:hypothetical protein
LLDAVSEGQALFQQFMERQTFMKSLQLKNEIKQINPIQTTLYPIIGKKALIVCLFVPLLASCSVLLTVHF